MCLLFEFLIFWCADEKPATNIGAFPRQSVFVFYNKPAIIWELFGIFYFFLVYITWNFSFKKVSRRPPLMWHFTKLTVQRYGPSPNLVDVTGLLPIKSAYRSILVVFSSVAYVIRYRNSSNLLRQSMRRNLGMFSCDDSICMW